MMVRRWLCRRGLHRWLLDGGDMYGYLRCRWCDKWKPGQ